MLLSRCRVTTILCRLRVLPGIDLGRDFCSNDDYLNDIHSSQSVATIETEESNFRRFESANKGAIKKVHSMMIRHYQNPTIHESNAEVCGAFEYYNSEDNDENNHPNVYRRSRSASSPDRIQGRVPLPEKGSLVLDVNNMIEAVPNMVSLSKMRPSMDHKLIAFDVELDVEDRDEGIDHMGDGDGDGECVSDCNSYYGKAFFVKDLSTNIICKIDIRAAIGINSTSSFIPSIVDFEWAVSTTGSPVLYVVLDDNLIRPSRVMFLNIGELVQEMFPSYPDRIIEETLVRDFIVPKDMLHDVVTETDTAFNIDIGRSKDDKYIIISHQSKLSSEVSLISIPVTINVRKGKENFSTALQPVVLTTRQRGLKYYVDHAKGYFIVATNKPYQPLSTSPSSSSSSTSTSSSSSRLNDVRISARNNERRYKKDSDSDTFGDNDSNSNTDIDSDGDGDLWIIRCSSIIALKPLERTTPSSPLRRGRSDRRPHPFVDWDIIYPKATGFCPEEASDENSSRNKNRNFRNIISDFDIFKDKLVVYGRANGFSSVHMVDLKKSIEPKRSRSGSKSVVESGPGSVSLAVTDFTPFIRNAVGSNIFQIIPGANGTFDTSEVKFSITGPLLPEMHFSVDLNTGLPRKIEESLVKGKRKINPLQKILEKYTIITETAVSEDGIEISVTIVFKSPSSKDTTPLCNPVHRKTALISAPVPSPGQKSFGTPVSVPGQRLVGSPGPMVLIGYGAYGVSVPVDYDPQTITLLERGFTIGYAHCRGGGEYGAKWHSEGREFKKYNTFKDFITCSKYVIERGYTSPSLLCGMGSSAGGLIMGVMANEASQLFAALIMRHPFLDPYNTLQRPDLPLTVHEYEEFGDPVDPLVLKNLLSFSPCNNIRNQSYPAMFVRTGDMDQKVGPWESLKWVTRVRNMQKLRSLQYEEKLFIQSQSHSVRVEGRDTVREDKEEGRRKEEEKKKGKEEGKEEAEEKGSREEKKKEGEVGEEGNKKHSERLILFTMTPNTDHDGPSDPTEDMYLKAVEIVFLENSINNIIQNLDS